MPKPELIAVWKRGVAEMTDPHFAKAETRLSPESIDVTRFGHHMSMGFERGYRTYAFNGQANRDRFVNHYRRAYGAHACGKPEV